MSRSGIGRRMCVGVDGMRGRWLARNARRRGHRMIVQRLRRRMVEHVRVRAGRVMVVMMVMATGHHTRHGPENETEHFERTRFVSSWARSGGGGSIIPGKS